MWNLLSAALLMTAVWPSKVVEAKQENRRNAPHNFGEILQRIHELRAQSEQEFPKHILTSSYHSSGLDIQTLAALLDRVKQLQAGSLDVNVSEICLNRTEHYLGGLMNRQYWALQMFDATAKLPSGIMDGKITWLGSYSECTRAKGYVQYNVTTGQSNATLVTDQFSGQYCLASIPISWSNTTLTAQGQKIELRIGVCLPGGCNEQDAKGLVNTLLSVLRLNTTGVSSATCPRQDVPWSTGAIAVMCFVGFLVLLVAMGTVYDIYVQHAMTQFNTVQIRVPYETVNNSAGNAGEHALRVGEYAPIHDQAQYPAVANKSLSPPSYRGTIHKIIIAFSMYTNGAKVLNTRQGSGALTCVNGIRFLSLSWVIWGHTYAFIVFFVDNLAPVYQDLTKRWTMQVLLQGTFSVDTFFVLSGLLVTYLTLREMKKGSGSFRINWGLYYFHRFWRLTPPYMLVLMVYAVTTKYWATGPLWPEQGAMDQFCNETWWTNLLYVNNFVQMDKMCMGWSWYLSNDMQFYVVSPLILIPLFWHIVAGGAMLLYFLLASVIYTGLMCSIHNFGPGLATQSDQLTYFDLVYIKPYARIGPYLMGMVVGYVLYLTECKPKMNKMIALGGWVVATACALAVVYGVYDVYQGHPLSNDVGAFYNTMSRTVWGACVGWVIYACCTGYGGFVNTLLSWGAFVPLGRLTYCAYLIHPIIMFVVYSVRERLIFVTDVSATYFFFGHMVMTYGCAFVVSMVFEAPMMGLEKAILNRDKSV